MATLELTSENFGRTVSDGGIVLVDCWAAWCGGCKTFAPIFEKVAAEHPDCAFGKLDTQAESDLVGSLGVQHIPSLLVYRDGVLLLNQPGNFDEQALRDIIRQAQSLDMDAVRADIAAAEAGKDKDTEA
jgi:thioredoxin 1